MAFVIRRDHSVGLSGRRRQPLPLIAVMPVATSECRGDRRVSDGGVGSLLLTQCRHRIDARTAQRRNRRGKRTGRRDAKGQRHRGGRDLGITRSAVARMKSNGTAKNRPVMKSPPILTT